MKGWLSFREEPLPVAQDPGVDARGSGEVLRCVGRRAERERVGPREEHVVGAVENVRGAPPTVGGRRGLLGTAAPLWENERRIGRRRRLQLPDLRDVRLGLRVALELGVDRSCRALELRELALAREDDPSVVGTERPSDRTLGRRSGDDVLQRPLGSLPEHASLLV